ncbi:hypothetical protein COM39_18100 [Bacillus toyonensis]|nr:hypothetical protein COM39_18100 [Bacillus toyonensis]PHG66090.1 hypothetical protein COI59_14255 [Bacillus toyonensis]
MRKCNIKKKQDSCFFFYRYMKLCRLFFKNIPSPNFPLLICCFIYLSTFIFYIVEYLKKGKGKTYEKKSHGVFNANDVSFCRRRNDC